MLITSVLVAFTASSGPCQKEKRSRQSYTRILENWCRLRRISTGYYAWQLARRAHTTVIGEEEAKRGIATARERFCAMVIEPALQRIPPTCIAYLLSMASLGQTSSTSMVADDLNKTPQQVSSIRSRLLRESIIEAPSYGKVSFAIPYMRDYLNEHKAELEAEL